MPYNKNNNGNDDDRNRKHRVIKIVLITGGAVFLITGLVFVVVGFVDFFGAFGGNDMPTKFWMFFVGLPCLFIGITSILMGVRGNIARYIKNESVPIINEFSRDIKPAIRNFTRTIKGEDDIVCTSCGASNDHDSAFCKKCAKPMLKTCRQCGTTGDPDSVFCKGCGKPLN